MYDSLTIGSTRLHYEWERTYYRCLAALQLISDMRVGF